MSNLTFKYDQEFDIDDNVKITLNINNPLINTYQNIANINNSNPIRFLNCNQNIPNSSIINLNELSVSIDLNKPILISKNLSNQFELKNLDNVQENYIFDIQNQNNSGFLEIDYESGHYKITRNQNKVLIFPESLSLENGELILNPQIYRKDSEDSYQLSVEYYYTNYVPPPLTNLDPTDFLRNRLYVKELPKNLYFYLKNPVTYFVNINNNYNDENYSSIFTNEYYNNTYCILQPGIKVSDIRDTLQININNELGSIISTSLLTTSDELLIIKVYNNSWYLKDTLEANQAYRIWVRHEGIVSNNYLEIYKPNGTLTKICYYNNQGEETYDTNLKLTKISNQHKLAGLDDFQQNNINLQQFAATNLKFIDDEDNYMSIDATDLSVTLSENQIDDSKFQLTVSMSNVSSDFTGNITRSYKSAKFRHPNRVTRTETWGDLKAECYLELTTYGGKTYQYGGRNISDDDWLIITKNGQSIILQDEDEIGVGEFEIKPSFVFYVSETEFLESFPFLTYRSNSHEQEIQNPEP